MPRTTITNLPIQADGHNFWISSVDYFNNQITIGMPKVSVGFPTLAALTISNVTNIYSTYTDINTMAFADRQEVYPVFERVYELDLTPVVVVGITSSAEYFSHFELQVDTVNTFDTDPSLHNLPVLFDSDTGVYSHRPYTLSLTNGTTYYFRVRYYDVVGNVSAWSNIVSEEAGDTTAPGAVGSGNVSITTSGQMVSATVDGSYTQASDHAYYEWWTALTSTHPGGNGRHDFNRVFSVANKSGDTIYFFVAAVDASGNRSSGYTTNVGNSPYVPADYWTDINNVTDLNGDPILNVTSRGLEDENGATVIDFTTGSGVTDYEAELTGAINFGTGGALHLTDNAVTFAGTPIVGMEIIGRGLKLYQDANNYIIMEKDGASSVNFEVVGGTIKTSGGTSYVQMDSTGIEGYNSSTQRFELNADGSGWLGGASEFYWDTSGNVTIAGTVTVTNIAATTGTIAAFTIAANSLTSTNIGIHSAGYSEGAEILVGHATTYTSAEIGFKADGSGKVASNNFRWDTSGNVTMDGTFTSTATITGGTVQTATSGARVVMNTNGILGYDATTQRFNLDSDGSGWLGSASDFYWDSSGNVTIAGTVTVTNIAATTGTIADFTIAANSLTSTNIGIHSAGYTEGAEILVGHATTYASAEIGFKADGSGKIADGNFLWNTSGDVTMTGDFTSTAVITGGTVRTGSGNARVEMTSANGIRAYNSSSVQTVDIDTDGSGWLGLTGTQAISWNSSGAATIGGWSATADLFRSATSAERVQLDASKNRISIFDATNEKVVMGYLEGLGRNKAHGNATGGSSTYIDDTNQDWEVDQLIGLDISITGGTGSPQTRTITDNTATRIYASFSPAVDGTSDYEVLYTSSNYGFWALDGDELMIDGDVTYESGDWIVHNDASLKILDGSGNEIIRLGTDTGEKGLFIYNTVGTQLAKYISDEIFIGTSGDSLSYTVGGGLVIDGGGITLTLSQLDDDASSPGGAGFYMSATNLGYWSGSAWMTYMDNTGDFYLGGTSGKLQWDGAALAISGAITIESGSGFGSLTDSGDLADMAATPSGSALFLNSSYIGFYSSGSPSNYIQSDGSGQFANGDISWTAGGDFTLGDQSGNAQIFWDQSETQLILGEEVEIAFGSRTVPGVNIMAPDIRLWSEDSAPSSGYGYFTDGSNPYGGNDNNAIVNTINPWGQRDLVWECTPTVGDALDGGWGYNTFSIDRDLRYRYSGWMKTTGGISAGGSYFGLYNSATHTSALTADGSDSGESNPYFIGAFNLPNTTYWVTNAVTNGTMEADANWTSHNSPTSNIRSITQVHLGTYSRRIIVNGERQGIYSDPITLDAYQTYRITVWLYGDGNTWGVYVDDGIETHDIKEFGTTALTPISGEWTQHVLNFQPKERTTTASVYIVSAGNHSGTLYVDDVEIYSDLIANGDIEEVESTQTAFSGWAHVGTPTYCERSTTQEHGGTYSWRITVNAANEGVQTSKVQIANGNATSTSSGNLVDSGASFDTDGTAAGDKIYNNTDNTCTTVSSVTNGTTIDVVDNIFASGEAYIISSDESYIKLIGGYQYRCSIWLYGNASNEWQAKVSDGTNDYDFLETDNTTTLVPAASWTNYILDFQADANSDSAYIEITSIDTSGTLYIDDVTLQDTPWFLLVGYLHPDNYAGTESWGGVYHYKSGYKAPQLAVTDHKSMATTTLQVYRMLLANASTLTDNQYQYGPAIHVVDGSEPTLSAMLGNSMDTGWNIEGTTNISKYLVESPTIRGGDYANGNYVQLDEYGIHAYGGDGGYEKMVEIGSADGSGFVAGGNIYWSKFGWLYLYGGVTSEATITGGILQTSTGTSERVVIDGTGSNNNIKIYDSSNNALITLENDGGGLGGSEPGITMKDGTLTVKESSGSDGHYIQQYGNYLGITSGNVSNQGRFQHSNSYTGSASAEYPDAYFSQTISGSGGSASGYNIGVKGAGVSSNAGATHNACGGWFYGDNANDDIYSIGLVAESNGTQIRLMRAADNADKADFNIDASGYLHIKPSGDRIRLNHSGGVAADHSDIYTDSSGQLNIRPNGTGATQTGKLRLWDATGTGGDYFDMYCDANGAVRFDPGGLGTSLILMNPTIGSSMLVCSFDDGTTIQTDFSLIGGMRVSNNTSTTGAQAGIHFTTDSAYAGIFGVRAGSNQQGLSFYTENVADTPDRKIKVNITYDGNFDVVQGSYQLAGSDIISDTGQQTGDLATLVPFAFGLNGSIAGTDDWLRAINGTDPGQYRLPFDCTLIAATVRSSVAMQYIATDSHTIEVWVADGDADNSFIHAVNAITLNSGNHGDYGAGNTSLSTAFQAGDAIRVFFDVNNDIDPLITNPMVTLFFLMKAS